jgi:hypothetical protein
MMDIFTKLWIAEYLLTIAGIFIIAAAHFRNRDRRK